MPCAFRRHRPRSSAHRTARGLDEQKVTDVLDPKLFQFVRRDVCKIRPARADFEKWMKAVCMNAALTLLAQGRIDRQRQQNPRAHWLIEEWGDSQSPSMEESATDDSARGDAAYGRAGAGAVIWTPCGSGSGTRSVDDTTPRASNR